MVVNTKIYKNTIAKCYTYKQTKIQIPREI